MKEGPVHVTSAEYSTVRQPSWRGTLTHKTVAVFDLEVTVTVLVAARGPLAIELLYSNYKVDDDDLIRTVNNLFEQCVVTKDR